MIKAYIDFWKRAFDFSGRSTRPDYWWVYLINVIISTILVVGFVLIPFFSNVSHNPAILNDSTEIQKMILKYIFAKKIVFILVIVTSIGAFLTYGQQYETLSRHLYILVAIVFILSSSLPIRTIKAFDKLQFGGVKCSLFIARIL